MLEEGVCGRLQVERLGRAVAGDDPGSALERPELIPQTPEHAVGDRGCDPVDHQAHRTLERSEPLAEEVDQLHQNRGLGDLPERAVRHRQCPQVLDPATAGSGRLGEALGPGDENAEQLGRVARQFAAHHHRVAPVLLAREQPRHMVEERGASATAFSEQQRRLRGSDGSDDRVGLAHTIDEPALVGPRPRKGLIAHVSDISKTLVLIASTKGPRAIAHRPGPGWPALSVELGERPSNTWSARDRR